MKISDQIKELARKRGVTITELAELLNTSQGNLTNKLSRDNFRISELKDIANALEYSYLEIILRGNKEDAVISDDGVSYKKHNVYMMIDNDSSLLSDIKQNGFRDTTFRMLLLETIAELFEPEFQKIFGDTLDAYVPNDFKEAYKTATKEGLQKLGIGRPLSEDDTKED